MFPKSFLVAILALALAGMACGINVNVPVQEVTTGPTQTMPISVPAPAADPISLILDFGAGKLTLAPGAASALVEGMATYNVTDFKPEISVDGGNVRISSGDLEVEGLPSFRNKNFTNEWDLKLGAQPMALKINSGAYQGRMELGGLSLSSLEVNDGAADVAMKFSQPNLIQMDTLRYATGASNVELSGLGNANFANMIFRSGAGNYTLDFSGQLQRDANITIDSGVSQVVIIVPTGVSAVVTFKGGLSNITTGEGWSKTGADYVHSGSGPQLTFTITLGAGNLELKSSQ